MHYIQKQILDELRIVESERYAALNQHDVESGHFRYHLSQLVDDGYVEQRERGVYVLSAKGKRFVDELSADRIHPERMPKVITYTLLTFGEKILLQKKPKHPYKDLFNMIGGKVHLGESTQEASIREVREKTGEEIVAPVLKGVFEIRIREDGALFTHVIAYVYEAEITRMVESLVAFDRSELRNRDDLAPDLLAILNKLEEHYVVETIDVSIDSDYSNQAEIGS